MSITSEQFDKAFSEFQQFGPRRRIPIEQRWREALSDLNPEEFAALKITCQQIEEFACGLARQVRDRRLSTEAAQKQLEQRYPILTRERRARVWSQAMYFSMK